MSQLLINEYLRQLDVIKRVSGSVRETIVREAFKDLLKSWGRQEELTFIAEYPLKTSLRTNITVDGALLHALRMPLGFWEAKDAEDDLDAEVAKKFKKGYPQDNIIFSDDRTALLIQNRREVLRCDVTDTQRLAQLLKLFFAFERPEVASFRAAVDQFKADLPAVLGELRDMIDGAYEENLGFRDAAAKFLIHAQEAINPALEEADVREMLIQHILTEEIFAKIFDDSDFHQKNNVARELYALEGAFFTGALKRQTLRALEPYYAAIRAAAAQIASHTEKQTFLKVIYENFYKVYNLKAADRLGVVYTPNEVVRFIIEGSDWLCERHFAKSLIDKNVEILDPATGTGTFVCELLEHFRGQPKKLEHKYKNELHANEVAILPYYVANLNIEATYSAITGQYLEFQNLCFVDTLDNVGLHTAARGVSADLFAGVSEENVERIRRQNAKRISVVMGNPPYNANQANENDNNKNREYPHVDERIQKTYLAASEAQKTKLYDMYVRFFRWASDRLDENGIVAFVSNNSFIDTKTFDGFRKVLASEFNEVWVVDLKGNARTSGERRRKEGGNIFDDQIRVGVAIWFCVRKKGLHGCKIMYEAVRDYAKSDEKADFVSAKPLRERAFEVVRPDERGNWINLSDNDFDTLLPLGSKTAKAAKSAAQERAVFKLYSLGVSTNRDEWVMDFDSGALATKVQALGTRYASELRRLAKYEEDPKKYVFGDTLKWSETLKRNALAGKRAKFSPDRFTEIAYRPFVSLQYYADPLFSDRLTANHSEIFGHDLRGDTPCIAVSGTGSGKHFVVLATSELCDLHFIGDTQLFPLYRLDSTGARVDNITDWALRQFTTAYKGEKLQKKITKESIFAYCYGVLHDPLYRGTYVENLKRDFPRLPLYRNFWDWVSWGEELLKLHAYYRNVPRAKLLREDATDKAAKKAGQAPAVILRSYPNEGMIVIDSETSLSGIPREAWQYTLGSRAAIDWVLEQYRETKPKDPVIREHFDSYLFADYKQEVVLLLERVVTISTRTVELTTLMGKSKHEVV